MALLIVDTAPERNALRKSQLARIWTPSVCVTELAGETQCAPSTVVYGRGICVLRSRKRVNKLAAGEEEHAYNVQNKCLWCFIPGIKKAKKTSIYVITGYMVA